MSTTRNTVKILVPLDVLLDTRIATVARIDNDLATTVLKNGYHTRRSDFYDGVDKKQFDDLYAKRDLLTLNNAQCTNIIKLLKSLTQTLFNQAVETPYVGRIQLIINLHPYTLEDTTKKLIIAAISEWVDDICEVSSTYITEEELSPEVIKGTYDILFMYHYGRWLELHTKQFETTPINSVTLYVPAISFENNLDDATMEKIAKDSMHPIMAIKLLCAPFIKLEPIDVSAFSIFEIE